MKKIFFLGLMILSTVSVVAQGLNVDSLLHVLNTQNPAAEEQLDIYNKVCTYYENVDVTKMEEYAKEGLLLAQKEKNMKMISVFYSLSGRPHTIKGAYDVALEYYEKALEYALKAKSIRHEAIVYNDIAIAYDRQSNYTTALEYFQKALSACEEWGNKHATLSILSNIGGIYRSLNNSSRAEYYLVRAADMADELNIDIAKIKPYYDLAFHNQGMGEYDKAFDYASKALELSRNAGYKTYEALSLQALAVILSAPKSPPTLQNHRKAAEYAEESIRISEELGQVTVSLGAWTTLSDVYLAQKRYRDCDMAASMAWSMDSTNQSSSSSILLNMIKANIYLGNADKAAASLEKFDEFLSQYIETQYRETLLDTEVKYETEKKEIRIASLEKERQLYVWLGIAGILLAITLIVVLWQTKRNARKEKLLIATRSVLDGEMGERTRLARDLHDRLSGNLSAVKIGLNDNNESLQSVHDKLDICIEEIRRVAHNLMPASLQFGLKTALGDFAAQFSNVHFHFFGEEHHIEGRKAFVLYCCAVELVNNSLRHSGAKQINLQLVQSEKHVTLTVQDDGSGFDEKSVTKGIGLKSIYDRVTSCNGKIDISTSSGKGTETTIELNVGDV